jgi:hypothetical protein
MKKIAIAAAMASVLAGPAVASQCPALMEKIDAAMATATVDDATKAKVQALYDSGKAAHEAGDHPKSEADLGEAMKLLGI